jgi:hypothetical protein
MGQITDVEAWRHLADSYRWLACAECSISDLRERFSDADRHAANAMLPNITVALAASAVVYGRAIIEFYIGDRGGSDTSWATEHFHFTPAGDDDDVVWLDAKRSAMNKHLFHFSTNRELYERDGVDHVEWAGRPGGPPGAVHDLVDRLLSLLNKMGAVTPDSTWKVKCEELASLVERRRRNRRTEWLTSWSLDGVR